MCTRDETISTGINIDTVKESKLKAHETFNDSESIHLNRCITTGMLLKPTSKNIVIDNNVVIITQTHVIICAPETPIFLPINPDIVDPN
ncbi:hypothetical protein, partial [Staphylococcus hominis]|uniref:hypothetical protein n=1 Tax=Staphylococcus hominis TaxID=1290 RepID=UPI0039BFD92C